MHCDSKPSRRTILKLGATGAGLSVLPATALAATASSPPVRASKSPRNIIFMVSDGMSASVPILAESFSQQVRNGGTHWRRVSRETRTVHGYFDTAALNTLVTDSAATCTAWASGSRVFNGAINTLPDGTALVPIGKLARESGRRLGLVTTTTITHATPAGFAAQVGRRSSEADIATQYLNEVDVLLGGGTEFFSPARRDDGDDLFQRFADNSYTVIQHRSNLTAASRQNKILGVFGTSHLPYSIDHLQSDELQSRVPTLAEMTHAAITSLSSHEHGFLLQVEGGRVDHAAHANDAAALLWDQLAFDDAIGVVLDYAKDCDDTLVIITTDHGNANPGLNGMGTRYRDSTECFGRIALAKASAEAVRSSLRRDASRTNATIVDTVRKATGIELDEHHAEVLAAALDGRPIVEANRQHANFLGLLGQMLGNHTGIGWTGITHTADPAMVMAVGPGSEMFHGLMLNTEGFVRLTDALHVNHRNPSMTAEQASRFSMAPVPELELHIGM